MTFDYVAAQKLLLVLEPAVPVIKGWNRLDGRPRALDFERSLRAEVRDALWFLTRQWQFGEFQGEDAASPVEARTLVASAPFEHYAAKGGALSRYDATIPLEARVEGEPIARDLVTCVQVTRYFFMLIAGEPNLAVMRALYLDAGAYALDTSAIDGVVDADATAMLALGTARTLDGAKLLAEIPSGAHDARVDAFPGLSADERSRLKEAAQKLSAWSQRLYRAPSDASDDAWAPRFLEYQFACVTKNSDGVVTTLAAESYDRGRLEWYAFDIDATAIPPSPEPGPEPVPIPSPAPGAGPIPAPGPARARRPRSPSSPRRSPSAACRAHATGNSKAARPSSPTSTPTPPTSRSCFSPSSRWSTRTTGACCLMCSTSARYLRCRAFSSPTTSARPRWSAPQDAVPTMAGSAGRCLRCRLARPEAPPTRACFSRRR
jgi:hypothetical protein